MKRNFVFGPQLPTGGKRLALAVTKTVLTGEEEEEVTNVMDK